MDFKEENYIDLVNCTFDEAPALLQSHRVDLSRNLLLLAENFELIGDFPIKLLYDYIDIDKHFSDDALNCKPLFINCIRYILELVENTHCSIPVLKSKITITQNESLQSDELVLALFYVYSVLSSFDESKSELSDIFINSLFIIVFNSKGLVCQWALMLLRLISSFNLEYIENFDFVRRISCIFKSSDDDNIKKYALLALCPFMASNFDEKRKKKIIEDLINKVSQQPQIASAIINLIISYVESTEDIEEQRFLIISNCIDLLKKDQKDILKTASYALILTLSKSPDEFFEDEILIKRIVERINEMLFASDSSINIIGISMILEILSNKQFLISYFENLGSVQTIFENMETWQFAVVNQSVPLVCLFLELCSPNFLANIFRSEGLLMIFEHLEGTIVENIIRFINDIMVIICRKPDSIWGDLDFERIQDSLDYLLSETSEASDAISVLMNKINEILGK